MVSKASEDFPEPDRPVNTIMASRGRSRSTLRRLCSRAPFTTRRDKSGRTISVDTDCFKSFLHITDAAARSAPWPCRARLYAARSLPSKSIIETSFEHAPLGQGKLPAFQCCGDDPQRLSLRNPEFAHDGGKGVR